MLGDTPTAILDEDPTRRCSDDSSEQLSKLIEQLSNSVSVSAALRSSRQTSGESTGRSDRHWLADGRQTFDSHDLRREGRYGGDSLTFDSSEQTSERTSDGTEFDETESDQIGEDTTDLMSLTDSGDVTDDGSTSTTMEYGFIPVNYTIVGTISQCATPSDNHRRRAYSDDSLNLLTDRDLASDNFLPDFPVPFKGGKNVLDMFNAIRTDMDSIHKMVDHATSSSSGSFRPPAMLSASEELPSSNQSRDAMLSEIVARAAVCLKDLEDEKGGAVDLISQSLSSDPTANDIDREFLELMDKVQNINEKLGKPKSPGEILEEGEWDAFTPIIDTPPVIPHPPSSVEADAEVRMITEASEASTTHHEEPDIWPIEKHPTMVSMKTHPSHTTESEIVITEPTAPPPPPPPVRSEAVHQITVVDRGQQTPEPPEIPNFLRLFVKPGEKVDDFIPNTPLLNALLAHSGLTIKPIVSKVNASLNTSFKDDVSDRTTSKMSSISEDTPKSVTISVGKPPRLATLTDRTLSDAMGSPPKTPSERTSTKSKPKILLNRKPTPERKKTPEKEPSPPAKVLTMEMWTNTETEKETKETAVETTTVQTEDRAVSPIVTMELPPEKPKKKKKSKSKSPPVVVPPPPAIVVEEAPPLEETPPGYLYTGNDVPEISVSRDPGLYQQQEPSPSDTEEGESIESLPPKEPTPPRQQPPPPAPVESSSSEDSEEEEKEEEETKTPTSIQPEMIRKEVSKAVDAALKKNRQVSPDTLNGLKEQLMKQNAELARRREVLVSSRKRMRGMRDMFNMERSGTNTPIDDII
eukprot:sb/3462185/